MPEQQSLYDFLVRCADNSDKVGFTFVDDREFLGWIADVTEDRMLVMWAPSPVYAQATGGDHRGRQSAAIKVYWKRIDSNPYLDIRVDDHHTPIPELRAIVAIYRGAYPTYHSRTWPELEGTGGYPILYP